MVKPAMEVILLCMFDSGACADFIEALQMVSAI
jgi:hypothetical protein